MFHSSPATYPGEEQPSPLLFSHLISKVYFPDTVQVYVGSSYWDGGSYKEIMTSRRSGIKPQARFNQHILGAQLPKAEVNRGRAYFYERISSCEIKSASEFDLLNALNQAELSLPENFFLTQESGSEKLLDTALSKDGLNKFMSYYASAMKINAMVFGTADEFNNNIQNIQSQILADKKDMACLVCFDKSKRHVTGFYFKFENKKITAYLFDSTGLTFPAWPCGERGYRGSENLALCSSLEYLKNQDISISLMPINMVLSIQHDRYSCLIATVLFFNSMHQNHYQILDNPGIIECYGCSAFDEKEGKFLFKSVECGFYTTNYLPLLVGVQDAMALLFMIDPLQHGDILLPEIAQYQTDWQRQIKTQYHGNRTCNLFLQAAYLELLKWFDICHKNQNMAAPFPVPGFEDLVKHGYDGRTEKSAFEIQLFELSKQAENECVKNIDISLQYHDDEIRELSTEENDFYHLPAENHVNLLSASESYARLISLFSAIFNSNSIHRNFITHDESDKTEELNNDIKNINTGFSATQ